MKTALEIKPADTINYAEHDLLLIAGRRHCSIGVLGHGSKELIGFSSYTVASDSDDQAGFFRDNELLKERFSRVLIAYDSNESVLIPSPVYHSNDIQIHLQTLYGNDAQTSVVSESLPAWDLYNVYRLPTKLHNLLQVRFISGNSWHLYSVMLKNMRAGSSTCMFVDFKTDELSVLALNGSKLLLAQTFIYHTPEDILYHLLKVCQQLELSQQEVKVVLSGLIEKDSSVYRELYKYFIHLEFDVLHGQVKLAEQLKSNPEHYYSSISKLAACV